METECYPCIPMQSASNQKSIVMIKNEPLSEEEDDGDDEEEEDDPHFVNVVDDNEESIINRQQKVVAQKGTCSSISGNRRAKKKTLTSQKKNSNNQNNNSKINVSLLATKPNAIEQNTNNNVFFVKKQSNIVSHVSTNNPLLATVVSHNGETKVTPMSTASIGSLIATCSTTGKVRMQSLQQQKYVKLTRVSNNKNKVSHLFSSFI